MSTVIVAAKQTAEGVEPDIPDGVKWISYTRRPDGTYLVTLTPGYAMDPYRTATRIATAKAILAEELDPQQIGAVAIIYPEWSAGAAVKIGDFRRYADELYSCLQEHTTQSDWTPDIVPALWRHWPKVAAGEEYPAWTQPLGSHDSYRIGDCVTHAGKNWECTAGDAEGYNSWEPGVYGWTEIV
jgi:hypothetical protein